MREKHEIVGDGGVMVEQFWKDNGNKALAIAAAIGAGATAILLVKAYFEGRRRKKMEMEKAGSLNVEQFVESAMELGQDLGPGEVSAVADALANSVPEGELADAVKAVGMIASEQRRRS